MFDETVDCPYCGHEHDMSEGTVDLPSDNKFDKNCDICGEEFEVEVEFHPSYGASKIIYDTCDCCSETVRDFYRKGFVLPFPENLNGEVFCKPCFYKAYKED
ncbi:hypothetical protein [Priestia megaterium]|uniref:hypothetical protein n=1 Tax=Priestia megaterium TaxID=1404 RepID=UPI002877574F|nr:hypothetical protein [Priestia megaterium]